jgi:hypothetical protein
MNQQKFLRVAIVVLACIIFISSTPRRADTYYGSLYGYGMYGGLYGGYGLYGGLFGGLYGGLFDPLGLLYGAYGLYGLGLY